MSTGSSIRLTDEEFEQACVIMLELYPSSYRLEDGKLHRAVGPTVSKESLSNGELVSILHKILDNVSGKHSAIADLIESIGRERRECDECGSLYIAHRWDQRFCPGGKCSNRFHQRKYRGD